MGCCSHAEDNASFKSKLLKLLSALNRFQPVSAQESSFKRNFCNWNMITWTSQQHCQEILYQDREQEKAFCLLTLSLSKLFPGGKNLHMEGNLFFFSLPVFPPLPWVCAWKREMPDCSNLGSSTAQEFVLILVLPIQIENLFVKLFCTSILGNIFLMLPWMDNIPIWLDLSSRVTCSNPLSCKACWMWA